jgi:hypothetical protein
MSRILTTATESVTGVTAKIFAQGKKAVSGVPNTFADSRALAKLMAVVATSVVLLSACAENHGRTATRPDARPFAEARAECWAESMNIAGYAASGAQTRAYDACMARNGWADLRGF